MSTHTADYFLQVPVLALRNVITKLTITCKPQNKTQHSTEQGNLLPTFYMTCLFHDALGQKSRVTSNCLFECFCQVTDVDILLIVVGPTNELI